MIEQAGSVIVARTSPKDIGMRDLYVVIDDKEESTLLHGQALKVQVEPGTHRVKVTNRLVSKTMEFEVTPGGEAKFIASNKLMGGILGAIFSIFVVIGGTGAYKVTLERA